MYGWDYTDLLLFATAFFSKKEAKAHCKAINHAIAHTQHPYKVIEKTRKRK